jgi:hypothetical protein
MVIAKYEQNTYICDNFLEIFKNTVSLSFNFNRMVCIPFHLFKGFFKIDCQWNGSFNIRRFNPKTR